jgi:hypothetical protein
MAATGWSVKHVNSTGLGQSDVVVVHQCVTTLSSAGAGSGARTATIFATSGRFRFCARLRPVGSPAVYVARGKGRLAIGPWVRGFLSAGGGIRSPSYGGCTTCRVIVIVRPGATIRRPAICT